MTENLIHDFEEILDEAIETILQLDILPSVNELDPKTDVITELNKLAEKINVELKQLQTTMKLRN
jgi:division protein CdvB (Snf7/Vps24/ESCRT-III family)